MQLDLVDGRHVVGLGREPLRWSTWKFDTPIERARPSALNSSIAFHVDT